MGRRRRSSTRKSRKKSSKGTRRQRTSPRRPRYRNAKTKDPIYNPTFDIFQNIRGLCEISTPPPKLDLGVVVDHLPRQVLLAVTIFREIARKCIQNYYPIDVWNTKTNGRLNHSLNSERIVSLPTEEYFWDLTNKLHTLYIRDIDPERDTPQLILANVIAYYGSVLEFIVNDNNFNDVPTFIISRWQDAFIYKRTNQNPKSDPHDVVMTHLKLDTDTFVRPFILLHKNDGNYFLYPRGVIHTLICPFLNRLTPFLHLN